MSFLNKTYEEMEICFVSLPTGYNLCPSPAIALLAGIARSLNIKTSLIDMAMNLNTQSFIQQIGKSEADIIAFCSVSELTLSVAKEYASYTKKGIIIAGGPIFSFIEKKYMLQYPFDVIFTGNSETVFIEWLISRCPTNNKIIHGRYEFIDILPDYSLFMQNYQYQIIDNNKIVFAEYSRGCNNHCDFCTIDQIFSKNYYAKPIVNFEREINSYPLYFGHVSYTDSLLNQTEKDFSIICDIMGKTSMTWDGMMQAMDLPDTLIDNAAASGLTDVFVGVESFSENMRKKIGKHGLKADIRHMIRSMSSRGINVHAGIIVASEPYQTDDDFKFDMATLKEMSKYLYLVYINKLGIPNGTNLYKNSAHIGVTVDNNDCYNWHLKDAEMNKIKERVVVLKKMLSETNIIVAET